MVDDNKTHTVTHFADAAEWTGVTDADRTAWLAHRRTIVTASSVAALLGLDDRRGPLDVYAETLAPNPSPDGPMVLDDPRTWGKALERAIAETAAQAYGWRLQMGGSLLRSRRYPFLGATLDAEIQMGASDHWMVYEGKTTSWMRRRDWDDEAGVPPDRVLCQTQTQLLVTGASLAVVFCLIGGQRPCRIDVTPNAEFHDLIIETAEEFMGRINTMDPPPPDWRSRDALQRLYPQESGEAIQLSREAQEWTRELQDLASRRLESERREKEIKALIQATLGAASYGLLPEPTDDGDVLWKNLTESRAEHVVRASSSRVLRLVKTVPRGLVMRKNAPSELPEHMPRFNEFVDRLEKTEDNLVKVTGRRRRQ